MTETTTTRNGWVITVEEILLDRYFYRASKNTDGKNRYFYRASKNTDGKNLFISGSVKAIDASEAILVVEKLTEIEEGA